MAAAATMPKTIFITMPSVSPNTNYVQYQTAPKIGTKRTFSIVQSPAPVSLSLAPQSSLIAKSPSPSAMTSGNGNVWLPATVQRPYKFETVDDDDYEYGDDSEDQSQYADGDGDSDQPPRKRERLTHLTAEEKMFRRKMKNRIAAQTARDRKKALMVDLEETVRRLEEENDTLAVENTKLRHEQSSLADENERLKKMLAESQKQPQQQQQQGSAIRHDQDDAHTVSAFGPAASISVPLPKEQAKAEWALTWLVASALIQLYSTYCVKSLPQVEQDSIRRQLEQLKESGSLTLEDVLSRSPSEAMEKLWEIIRSYKTSRLKPP